jgi:hypothetical protein
LELCSPVRRWEGSTRKKIREVNVENTIEHSPHSPPKKEPGSKVNTPLSPLSPSPIHFLSTRKHTTYIIPVSFMQFNGKGKDGYAAPNQYHNRPDQHDVQMQHLLCKSLREIIMSKWKIPFLELS